MFDEANYGWFEGAKDEYVTLEEPVEGATYVTGVDWAKENDWTIMRTYRTDVDPWVEVAFLRTGRKPWPEMVATSMMCSSSTAASVSTMRPALAVWSMTSSLPEEIGEAGRASRP